MLGEVLLQKPWLAALIWALLYASDYALTLWGETLYRRGAKKYWVYEGSTELNPEFADDVAALRWVNPRFLFIWVASTAGLLVWGPEAVRNWPKAFEFMMGVFIFPECVIHVRHFVNIWWYKLAMSSGAVEGHIRMSRGPGLRVSAVEMLGMAAVFFFAFMLTTSWWMAGAATGCLYCVILHWFWLRRLRRGQGLAPT